MERLRNWIPFRDTLSRDINWIGIEWENGKTKRNEISTN